jgi:hypothetical protein
MPMQALENAPPSPSNITSGNRSDEATADTHEKDEKSKPGAAWKRDEVHEVPHKQVTFVLNF